MRLPEPRYHRAVLELDKLIADRSAYEKAVEEFVKYSWRRILKDEQAKTVVRVQATLLKAIREFLDSRGFVEVLPPIIGPVTDPGIRGARQVPIDFYGMEYRVMSSAILYKQLMATAMGRIYFVSPNIRLEPMESRFTGRHLVEFFQVDIEMFGASYTEAMELAEDLITSVVKRVVDEHWREIEHVRGDLPSVKKPFDRYPHSEAVKIVREYGCEQSDREELRWECEKLFSALHDTGVIVYDYPRGSRGFYDREDPARPGVLRDFDVLYPEGFGEAISGAEREYEPEKVIERIREGGEDPARYEWFLEMLREVKASTAGFGIGVERFTRYILGLPAVWMARPYPKIPGVKSP